MCKVQHMHSGVACQMGTNHAKKTINDNQRSTRVLITNANSMITSRLKAAKSNKTQSPVERCQLQSAHSEFQLRVCNQITEDAPQDHSQFTEDPQVMFSSFTTDQILEASLDDPLLPTSMHVKSSSSLSSPTIVVSDALPSSSVLTYDMRNQDRPTEDEETTVTRLGMASGETMTKKVQFCEPNSGRRKGISTTKNDIRNDRLDDPVSLDDSPTHCHSSAGSTSTSQHDADPTSIDARKEVDNSTSIFTNSIFSTDSPQCHTTSSMIDPESIEDDIRVLMNHSSPKSPQHTNVITADYTPRGRLFGAYTQRGLGITYASLKYPNVLKCNSQYCIEMCKGL